MPTTCQRPFGTLCAGHRRAYSAQDGGPLDPSEFDDKLQAILDGTNESPEPLSRSRSMMRWGGTVNKVLWPLLCACANIPDVPCCKAKWRRLFGNCEEQGGLKVHTRKVATYSSRCHAEHWEGLLLPCNRIGCVWDRQVGLTRGTLASPPFSAGLEVP